MSSEDLNKSLSESTRALAKAFLILGLETLDKVQKFSTQAQDYLQELVTEVQHEQSASKAQKSDADPNYKKAEVHEAKPVETADREENK